MKTKSPKEKAPGERRRKRRGGPHSLTQWLHGVDARCALVLRLGGLLVLAFCCVGRVPERYDLTVGSISRYTINATKDVVDETTTQERRNAAAEAVDPTYSLEEGASDAVLTGLKQIFEELRQVQQYGLALQGGDGAESGQRSFTSDEITYVKGFVTFMSLSDYQYSTLMRTSASDFDTMTATVTTAVENALATTIREGQVNQSIQTILQIVGYRVETSLYQTIVPSVLRACVKPNMVIDQTTTEEARQKARDAVEDVIYLQGQNIVREGDRVTAKQQQMLSALGLLKDDGFDMTLYAGALAFAILAFTLLIVLLRLLSPELLHSVKKLTVVVTVIVLTTGLIVAATKLGGILYAPVLAGVMLLCVLISPEAGVAGGAALSVIIGSIALGSSNAFSAELVYVLLTTMIAGVLAVRFLKGHAQRVRLVLCGIFAAALDAVVITAVKLMTSSGAFSAILPLIGEAAAGCVISCLIALTLQPLLEAIFNLATPTKLLELGNPNQPLLRRLMLEAPGTYHHSMIVANLAEAAAEKIGANPLLARTAAYFHDIGKLKRPMYFKENQMGENPHDVTDPYVSASILTNHTHDGVLLAQKYRLPPEIQQIILEHHGDTPVLFFYHKALQQADGKPVDIADFRYDGPRPTLKESAVIMLADTVEAAVRAMPDPTPDRIEKNIGKLVRGKLEDGQLSSSPLTLKDIDGICEAFAAVLNGVFHERIEYPQVEVPQRDAFFLDGQPAGGAKSAAAKPAVPRDMPEAEAAEPAAPVTAAAEPAKESANGTGPQKEDAAAVPETEKGETGA